MIDKSVKKQNESLHQFSSEIKVFSSRPDHSIAQEKPFIISRHLTATKNVRNFLLFHFFNPHTEESIKATFFCWTLDS